MGASCDTSLGSKSIPGLIIGGRVARKRKQSFDMPIGSMVHPALRRLFSYDEGVLAYRCTPSLLRRAKAQGREELAVGGRRSHVGVGVPDCDIVIIGSVGGANNRGRATRRQLGGEFEAEDDCIVNVVAET